MNTERLHAIAVAALEDLKSTKTVETLGQLVDALQNQVNQPQTAQFQQQVSNHLQTLNTALPTAPSNDFSPAWKQALRELGMHDLLGENLQIRIKEIFERNQITAAVALKELQALHKQLTTYKGAFGEIVSGFKQINIGAEELEPGQCEIGVLVPRSAVDNKLGEFAKDLEDLDKILGTFSELTTEKRPGFEIRSVSSSDLSVFLETWPVVAASIAWAVERIVRVYKNVLEIRKLHGELKDQGIPKKDLEGILKNVDSRMKNGIEKLIEDLLKEYYKTKDEGRRNELANELRFCLGKIANRIDKGYSIEVRAQPPSEEEGAEEKVTAEDRKHIAAILSASKSLEFLRLEGVPILTLPESQENHKGQEQQSG